MTALKRAGIALGYVWSLPCTVLGLFVAVFAYWPRWRYTRWHDGALEFVPRWIAGNPGGQCLGGAVICYRSEWHRDRRDLQIHERRHRRAGWICGPLFLVLYPAASLVAVLRGRHWYRDNIFERRAYHVQAVWLEVNW